MTHTNGATLSDPVTLNLSIWPQNWSANYMRY